MREVLEEGRTNTPVAHRSVQRIALVAAIALIAFYFATSVFIALRRPFWYDEVFSALIARLPDWSTMWRALAAGVDSMPPGFYLLVRLSESILGPSDFAARLPSVLALTVGLVITFDCARRLTDHLHALAALALLAGSLLPFYGYEARPYSLYFMFVALGLWLWLNTPDNKLSSLAFGLVAFAAFTIHLYSALSLVPYLAFEMVRDRRLRVPSAKLIAGAAGVVAGLVLCSRQVLAFKQLSHQFWALPSFPALLHLYDDYFPFVLAILAAALLLGAWSREGQSTLREPTSSGERLGWLFLLIPVAGYIAAKLVTNAFYNRYFIGMLPGVAVATACLSQRIFRNRPATAAAVILVALVCGVGKQVSSTSHPETIEPPFPKNAASRLSHLLSLEPALLQEGKTEIVLRADDILGLEARYYSKRPGVYAFLVEPDIEVTGQINQRLAKFSPMRFWSMDQLRSHAKEIALVDPSQKTLDWLNASGLQIKPRSKDIGIYYFY